MIGSDGKLVLEPIGWLRSELRQKADARRQGSLDRSGSIGVVEFAPGKGLESALRDLEGFERAWLVYGFHLAVGWKPTTIPPRGPRRKRGVFATRSPYRPNPLGLSSVRLLAIDGLRVSVTEHDLLDRTPIYDIKPYVASADAFPDARAGWLEGLDQEAYEVTFSPLADEQLTWLAANDVPRLREALRGFLEYEPLDRKRKRVRTTGDADESAGARAEIAYRTWRAEFAVDSTERRVLVQRIRSGYSPGELHEASDPFADKASHRAFARFEGFAAPII